MTSWLTTILIFLPVAGAAVVWLVPLPKPWVASLATLVSLVEVGVWIVAVEKFDFASGSLPRDGGRFIASCERGRKPKIGR